MKSILLDHRNESMSTYSFYFHSNFFSCSYTILKQHTGCVQLHYVFPIHRSFRYEQAWKLTWVLSILDKIHIRKSNYFWHPSSSLLLSLLSLLDKLNTGSNSGLSTAICHRPSLFQKLERCTKFWYSPVKKVWFLQCPVEHKSFETALKDV